MKRGVSISGENTRYRIYRIYVYTNIWYICISWCLKTEVDDDSSNHGDSCELVVTVDFKMSKLEHIACCYLF